MEVSGGVQEGDKIILNPSDTQRDGVKVNAVPARSIKAPGK
jgi:hypothetical protein